MFSFSGIPENSRVLGRNSIEPPIEPVPLVTLKNPTPNTSGKGYNLFAHETNILNGKIFVAGRENTTGNFDFVITLEGQLVVGSGHYTLSGGAEKVFAAGTMKIVNGQLKGLTNSSGHYQPVGSPFLVRFKNRILFVRC